MKSLSTDPDDLAAFAAFVQRSSPPLRSLEIKDAHSFVTIDDVRGYLVPTIACLALTDPSEEFLSLLSQPSESGHGVLVLPALAHLELTDCDGDNVYSFAPIIPLRWDMPETQRSLKSIKLIRSFEFIPKCLFSPPRTGIDLAKVREDWQGVARCVNEGLVLSRGKLPLIFLVEF